MPQKPVITNIAISSVSQFIESQSDVDNNRFVFCYQITIANDSAQACKLMSRHWVIQDSNGKVEEVFGEGVIGEQPIIQPGEKFSYTSNAILETEIGTMEGRYFFIGDSNSQSELESSKTWTSEFEVFIPKFTLSVPRVLH